eukprot:1194700-Prorocentrum_minimum.AAC.2
MSPRLGSFTLKTRSTSGRNTSVAICLVSAPSAPCQRLVSGGVDRLRKRGAREGHASGVRAKGIEPPPHYGQPPHRRARG